MSRPIQFRGKRIDNGEWVYGMPAFNRDCTGIDKIEEPMKSGGICRRVHPETVGQYTGLTDRNGKEVYEGDIVKYTSKEKVGERTVSRKRGYDTYSVHGDVEIIGVVKYGTINKPFVEGIQLFYVDTDETISYDTYFWGSGKKSDRPDKTTSQLTKPLYTNVQYEVIGSIYTHPHLMEVQA